MARAVKKVVAARASAMAAGRSRHPAASAGVLNARLEQRLVLLRWVLHLLGIPDNRALLESCANTAEGLDADGVFLVTKALAAQVKNAGLRQDLLRYDGNLRRHLEAINLARAAQPLQLRYFQVLSLLFTEIYLDRLANTPGSLLVSLNGFLSGLPERGLFRPFGKADLRKLAFWMATGSGKTLLLHFHLRQYRHYFPGALNNILLITPNEGLSAQHIAEARASGISVERFDPERPALLPGGDLLQVIEITKLVEDKKGGGVTVPVSRFLRQGVPNLIFVDEGHKGSGGEVWKGYRDQLGATGFTFEYSATFGQALNATGNEDLLAEYGKAILFDYSYRYFHGDGFGKDFRLLNVDSGESAVRDALMGANLLGYYQQLRVFDNGTDWRPYGIAKPLWVYVGASVNSGKTGGSDIAAVLKFFDRFLANKGDWSTKLVKKLLHDPRLFRSDDGRAGLHEALEWLRSRYPESSDFGALLGDVMQRVFHLSASGARLEVQPIRGAEGEIALSAQGATRPFGVVNVGDSAALVKLLETDGTPVLEDVVGDSLFANIEHGDSSVNLLIGAKKFIEGWSSWRVGSLGLLNVGKSEGAQIIQLFGRGVRLLGLGRSLKRSTALPGVDHPEDIRWLETLNVFSVHASYMRVFREALLREGVEDLPSVTIELPLWRLASREPEAAALAYFEPPAPERFRREFVVSMGPATATLVRHDASARFTRFASTGDGLTDEAASVPAPRVLGAAPLALVDWHQAYFRLIEKKRLRGWTNAVVRPQALREIAAAGCEFVADDEFFAPQGESDIRQLQEAVCEALEAWFEKDYRRQQKQFETRHMRVSRVSEAQAQYPPYRVLVRVDQQPLIQELQALATELAAGRVPAAGKYPLITRSRFDRHLYQPLLISLGGPTDASICSPRGLEPSEREFVEALQQFCEAERDGRLKGRRIYLLRNQSRGHGLGFYENEGFFPDFILWNVGPKDHRVLFIEPHGLMMERRGSDKITGFHERLQTYVARGLAEAGRSDITVDGWIISQTPISDLRKQWGVDWDEAAFAKMHVLFPQGRYDSVIGGLLLQS